MKWIFVTGNQWGGKELFRQIINYHTDAEIFSDTNYPINFYDICIPPINNHQGYKHSFAMHLTTLDGKNTESLAPNEWSNSLHIPYLANTVINNNNSPIYGQPGENTIKFIRNLCESIKFFYPGKNIFGDCSVLYAFRWETLLKIFPDSKLIVVHRDVKKCIDTIYNGNDSFVKYLKGGHLELERYLHLVDEYLKKVPKDISYHLDIKEFKQTDPKITMPKLWEYLDIDSPINFDFVKEQNNLYPED